MQTVDQKGLRMATLQNQDIYPKLDFVNKDTGLFCNICMVFHRFPASLKSPFAKKDQASIICWSIPRRPIFCNQ